MPLSLKRSCERPLRSRDTDAAEAAAGDEQTRMAGKGAVDRRHAIEMTDFVLRIAAGPSVDARQPRLAVDTRAAALAPRARSAAARRSDRSSA